VSGKYFTKEGMHRQRCRQEVGWLINLL
jgi:hypothetical protein